MDLKWHESGYSELDDMFGEYDKMERFKVYIMAGCLLFFWMSLGEILL